MPLSMSGLPPKADISGPASACPLCARSGHWAGLFDHLVGQRDELLGNGQPERLGGLAVDYQLESGRLLDRQLGRARATQDLIYVGGRAPGELVEIGAVAQQRALARPRSPARREQ